VLDTNVEVLNKNPGLKIEVQGHTDSIASEVYNQGLSEKRADSAKTYLTTKGIDGQRISTLGFGESHPAASNETPEGRSENRRIEIKVLSR
jgi:OOP family OmpA-OmpF porin